MKICDTLIDDRETSKSSVDTNVSQTNPLRILVADDDRSILNLYGKVLSRQTISPDGSDGMPKAKGTSCSSDTVNLLPRSFDIVTCQQAGEAVDAVCFFKAIQYFKKQKQYDDALNIMLKGIEYLPDNAKISIAAASLYEQAGIFYRATEDHKHALIFDPKKRYVRKKLKELEAI